MQTIFYKALRANNKHLISANVAVTQRYFTNRVNKPKFKNSKLFVFGLLEDAINFCAEEMWGHKMVIYSCRVTNPKIVKRIPGAHAFKSLPLKDKSDVWNHTSITDDFLRFDTMKSLDRKAPANTYVCDSVELLTKLETIH